MEPAVSSAKFDLKANTVSLKKNKCKVRCRHAEWSCCNVHNFPQPSRGLPSGICVGIVHFSCMNFPFVVISWAKWVVVYFRRVVTFLPCYIITYKDTWEIIILPPVNMCDFSCPNIYLPTVLDCQHGQVIYQGQCMEKLWGSHCHKYYWWL